MEEEVFNVTAPWFKGEGDPIPLLEESLGKPGAQSATSRGPFYALFLMPLRWMNGWKKCGRIS